MAPLPMIEHLDILKDVLCRLAPRRVLSMVHEFTLQRPEETFHAGVVPAIAFAAHAGRDAVRGEQLLVLPGSILGGFNRSTQHWVVRRLVGTGLGLRLVFSNQASSAVWY